MTKKNWYQPRWAVIWFGRDGKIRYKSFVKNSQARREEARHDRCAVLLHEVKVKK